MIKTDGNLTVILVGVENQSEIHYAMPVKNLVYDALNYGAQVNEAAKLHRKNKDTDNSAEFLSGFKKLDKLTPIVTITVYWGTKEWDGPTNLYEMFDKTMDRRLLRYVPNYEIALISPNNIKDFSKFRSELGLLLEVIKNATDRNTLKEFISSDKRFTNVDNETVSAINVFTGIEIPVNEREGATNMSNLWEEIKEDYIEEGIEREKLTAIQRMIRKGYSKEQILELEYTEEEYTKAEATMCVEV